MAPSTSDAVTDSFTSAPVAALVTMTLTWSSPVHLPPEMATVSPGR